MVKQWMLVAGAHSSMRAALSSTLRALVPGAECWEASSAREVDQFVDHKVRFQLVVLDMALPGIDFPAIVSELSFRISSVGVVVIGEGGDREAVAGALGAGAVGFVSTGASPALLQEAFKTILAGGIFLPQEFYATLTHSKARAMSGAMAGGRASQRPFGQSDLNERQQDLLALLCEGKSYSDIARELGINQYSITAQVDTILRTFGIASNSSSLALAGR